MRARLLADAANQEAVRAGLYLRYYGADDELVLVRGPEQAVAPQQAVEFTWQIPAFDSDPIAEIGVAVASDTAASGTLYLDYLTWDGEPQVTWERPTRGGAMWRRAWVDAIDHYFTHAAEMFRLAQDSGRGLLIQGTRQWQNIAVQATIAPYMAKRFGLATRVQGLQRYYALLLGEDGCVELLRVCDEETVLATTTLKRDATQSVRLCLQIVGNELQGWVDDECLLTAVDSQSQLVAGGIAVVVEEGCICVDAVQVRPAQMS